MKPIGYVVVAVIAAAAGFGIYQFAIAPRMNVAIPQVANEATGIAPAPSEAAAEAESSADGLPETLPDFTLANLDGQPQSIRSWPGKSMIVNFWATWCPPCIAEMPGINELYKTLLKQEDIAFIMVDADGDLNTSQAFMKAHNYDLPLYAAASGTSSGLFTGTLPSTIIINKKGNIVFRETGAANYNTKQFKDFVKNLSAE